MTKSCCFTGYRPHKFGFEFSPENKEFVTLENKLIDAVFSLADEGCYKFYCGVTQRYLLHCTPRSQQPQMRLAR